MIGGCGSVVLGGNVIEVVEVRGFEDGGDHGSGSGCSCSPEPLAQIGMMDHDQPATGHGPMF